MSCSMLLLVPISSRRELDIASVSEAEGDRLAQRGHGAPARAEHAGDDIQHMLAHMLQRQSATVGMRCPTP